MQTGCKKTNNKEALCKLINKTKHEKKKSEHFSIGNIIQKNAKKARKSDIDLNALYNKNDKDKGFFGFDYFKLNNSPKESKPVKEDSPTPRDSDCSNSSEKIGLAFGIEKSFSRTPKISSEISQSFTDTDPVLEKSMLKEEIRTLSFLEEDDDLSEKPKRFRNSLIYNLHRKFTLTGKQINVSTERHNRFASMFSTQDSRPKHDNLSGGQLNSCLQEINRDKFIRPRLGAINEMGNNRPVSFFSNIRTRRQQPSSFNIDLSQIIETNKTTLMIRNIPNKYTKELMLETLDEDFMGTYDFFYLPIDFKNGCNVGYAFINFKELKYIEAFYKRFDGMSWKRFNSEKICQIKYARIQGKRECELHFKGSSLMNQPVG